MDNWQTFRPFLLTYFIVSVGLYFLVHFFRFLNQPLPLLINSYLTDFLCMPIVLTICLVGVRAIKKIPDFKLTLSMIVGMTVFYAVLFELILPMFYPIYHADFVDLFMYVLGAFMYFLIWRKSSV